MEKPISVGDFVYVAKTCCGIKQARFGGFPFVVHNISTEGNLCCSYCGYESNERAARQAAHPNAVGVPISWLKRIDPLALPETVRTEDEVTA